MVDSIISKLDRRLTILKNMDAELKHASHTDISGVKDQWKNYLDVLIASEHAFDLIDAKLKSQPTITSIVQVTDYKVSTQLACQTLLDEDTSLQKSIAHLKTVEFVSPDTLPNPKFRVSESTSQCPLKEEPPDPKQGGAVPRLNPLRRQRKNQEWKLVPAHLQSRLTITKFNQALGDLNQFLNLKYRLLTAPPRELNHEEFILRERFLEKETAETSRLFWFSKDDVRLVREHQFKFDTTGLGIISVLRHLGRLVTVGKGRSLLYCLSVGAGGHDIN